MPYIVTNGEVHQGGKVYRCGQIVPGPKGALADIEEAGAVAWKDSRKKADNGDDGGEGE